MKKLVTVIILVFLVGYLACKVTLLKPEVSRCDITTLTLDAKEMPPGWYETGGILAPDLLRDKYNAKAAISIALEKDPKHSAGHRVYRYANSWWAKFFYWFYRAYFSAYNPPRLSDLKEAHKLPLHADQVTITCGYFEAVGQICAATLRYGSDISDFSSYVGEGFMSLEEFQKVILKIDSHFVSCMN